MKGLTDKQIKESLKYATMEGAASAGMVGFSEQYITPFALAVGATKMQVGLLNSIPNFFMIFFTLKAANLVEKIGSRKKAILILVVFDVLSLVPLLLVPLFLERGPLVWFTLIALSFFLPPIMISPIWGSLMADIVPTRRMGKYFGKRSAIVGLTTLACSFIAAWVLNLFGEQVMTGFVIIFVVAIAFRIASWLCYTKIHEPPMQVARSQPFGFVDFVKETKSSNLARFIIFICLMNFTLNLAGPFQTVYLINNLELDYVGYMIILNASAVATLFTLGYWGRLADKLGNVKIVKAAAVLMPIAPIMWAFSHNFFYLMAAQLLAGFAWAGFNLCGPNFIYEASPKERRGRYLAYFSAINVGALALGAFAGGFLSNVLPPIAGSRLLSLFLLAGILRALIAAVFLPRIEEVRFAGRAEPPKLFYNPLSVSPMVRGGLFHNPLAYKPIIAEAQTYRPRTASRYSLFYNPFIKFVVDTAAEPKPKEATPSFGLYHNKEAAEKARATYTSSEDSQNKTREPSPWVLFRRPSKQPRPPAQGEILPDSTKQQPVTLFHNRELRKKHAASSGKTGSDGTERQPVTLFHNREMKGKWQVPKGSERKTKPSKFAPFYNKPADSGKRSAETPAKVRKWGLFYRPVPPDDVGGKRKKK